MSEDGSELCTLQNGGLWNSDAANPLISAGARIIWAKGKQSVTLKGSPKINQVTCTATADNILRTVQYKEESLAIDGDRNNSTLTIKHRLHLHSSHSSHSLSHTCIVHVA